MLVRRFADRMIASATRVPRAGPAAAAGRAPAGDVEGTAVDVEPTTCRGGRGERARPDGRRGLHRRRHLLVRRPRGGVLRARPRGRRAGPTARCRAARSACCSPAASRSGSWPRAARRSAPDADWGELRLPGLAVTHARGRTRAGGSRCRRRAARASTSSSRRRRRRRSSRGRRRRAPRRHGGPRAAVPRPRHGGRAADRLPRPARPRLGHGGLEPDRAHALARRVAGRQSVTSRPSARRAPRATPRRHLGRAARRRRRVPITDPRISTTYDGDGHQRRAGLELWVGEDDDYPRRGAGQVLCGSSVELGSCGSTARSSPGSSTAATASGATTSAPRLELRGLDAPERRALELPALARWRRRSGPSALVAARRRRRAGARGPRA